jgi:hypothetical protein
MKNICLLLTILIFTGSAEASNIKESKVPAQVVQAFKKDYPNIPCKWEKEGGNYEANFKLQGSETSVLYDKDGNKLETEETIDSAQVPKPVIDKIKVLSHGKKVKEISRITYSNGSIVYEFEIGGRDILINENGEEVKK